MSMDLNDFGTNVASSSNKKDTAEPAAPTSQSEPESKDDLFFSQWTPIGSATYLAVSDTQKTLRGGMYTVEPSNRGMLFTRMDVKVDDLIRFPDSLSDKIITEIASFWTRHDVFKEYGFLHRRGYLFYGPQGSGKTAIVQQVVADIIKQGGLVFSCERPSHLNDALAIFRQVEPERKVVCLFEDIDAIVDRFGDSSLLSLLDGENQIDKVLNIATTNYPEKLDKRIISRPRRFDRVMKIGMPNDEIRSVYFERKLNIKQDELALWVKNTKGFSFAACAELVISVKCLGHKFEDAVEILNELLVSKKSSSDYDNSGKVGFGK